MSKKKSTNKWISITTAFNWHIAIFWAQGGSISGSDRSDGMIITIVRCCKEIWLFQLVRRLSALLLGQSSSKFELFKACVLKSSCFKAQPRTLCVLIFLRYVFLFDEFATRGSHIWRLLQSCVCGCVCDFHHSTRFVCLHVQLESVVIRILDMLG